MLLDAVRRRMQGVIDPVIAPDLKFGGAPSADNGEPPGELGDARLQ